MSRDTRRWTNRANGGWVEEEKEEKKEKEGEKDWKMFCHTILIPFSILALLPSHLSCSQVVIVLGVCLNLRLSSLLPLIHSFYFPGHLHSPTEAPPPLCNLHKTGTFPLFPGLPPGDWGVWMPSIVTRCQIDFLPHITYKWAVLWGANCRRRRISLLILGPLGAI
jgi:hypothetical protein